MGRLYVYIDTERDREKRERERARWTERESDLDTSRHILGSAGVESKGVGISLRVRDTCIHIQPIPPAVKLFKAPSKARSQTS